MNKLMIIGNLSSDPETRETKAGNVTSFNVAVNAKGKEPKAVFFRVAAWRQLGEICQKFLKKGKKVAVVGSVGATAYLSNGQPKASLEITAEDVEFLSPKEEPKASGFIETDEALPF